MLEVVVEICKAGRLSTANKIKWHTHTVRLRVEIVSAFVSGVDCHAFIFFVVDSKRRSKVECEILSCCSVQLDV